MAKPPDRKSNRPVSSEEEALFRAAMSDAKPLGKRGTAAGDGRAEPSKPLTVRRTASPPSGAQSAPLRPGATSGLDRRTMDRLRKGRLRPEARIDLHGMTAERARRALENFVADKHTEGKRCVLVITGKGSLKQGGGIIRREFPDWLNAPEIRPRVLGFAQAQPADGGAGAFYVLLRRIR